jgi:hypothetical protein
MPVLFDQKPAIRRLIYAVTLSSSKQMLDFYVEAA